MSFRQQNHINHTMSRILNGWSRRKWPMCLKVLCTVAFWASCSCARGDIIRIHTPDWSLLKDLLIFLASQSKNSNWLLKAFFPNGVIVQSTSVITRCKVIQYLGMDALIHLLQIWRPRQRFNRWSLSFETWQNTWRMIWTRKVIVILETAQLLGSKLRARDTVT